MQDVDRPKAMDDREGWREKGGVRDNLWWWCDMMMMMIGQPFQSSRIDKVNFKRSLTELNSEFSFY